MLYQDGLGIIHFSMYIFSFLGESRGEWRPFSIIYYLPKEELIEWVGKVRDNIERKHVQVNDFIIGFDFRN